MAMQTRKDSHRIMIMMAEGRGEGQMGSSGETNTDYYCWLRYEIDNNICYCLPVGIE